MAKIIQLNAVVILGCRLATADPEIATIMNKCQEVQKCISEQLFSREQLRQLALEFVGLASMEEATREDWGRAHEFLSKVAKAVEARRGLAVVNWELEQRAILAIAQSFLRAPAKRKRERPITSAEWRRAVRESGCYLIPDILAWHRANYPD